MISTDEFEREGSERLGFDSTEGAELDEPNVFVGGQLAVGGHVGGDHIGDAGGIGVDRAGKPGEDRSQEKDGEGKGATRDGSGPAAYRGGARQHYFVVGSVTDF